jgi:cyclophilin family peptidyl-prolyl cis-trans isomerase/HEAT repeat protein
MDQSHARRNMSSWSSGPFWLIVCALFVADVAGQTLRDRIAAAEDARVTDAGLTPVLSGLRQRDPTLVVWAVRALGRFERPALITHLLPLLAHVRPDVRAEAANALGQAVASVPRGSEVVPTGAARAEEQSGVVTVQRALIARLKGEGDPSVAGVAAETLGRLPYRTADAVSTAERAIVDLLPVADGSPVLPSRGTGAPGSQVSALTGAVKGLEALFRLNAKLQPPAQATVARLRVTASWGSDPSDVDLALIRRLSWAAINSINAADATLIERGLDDPDVQVRRLAVVALGKLAASDTNGAVLTRRALADQSFIVRYEAVRAYSRTMQEKDCSPVISMADDRNMHVALAAIDALGNGCPAGPDPMGRLTALAGEVGDAAPGAWHRPAHAFVAMARLRPERATPKLAQFAEHPIWQVRMYAARAATAMSAAARLERLATSDASDNVREAAIAGLSHVRRHDADSIYVAALARPDYQLVITSAKALEGSPAPAIAVSALMATLKRITAEHRDTSRDARLAILVRLRELGGPEHSRSLQPYLSDFDPVVASECAATLQVWTGVPTTPGVLRATPSAPNDAIPSATRARMVMKRGGTVELRLFADEAPATVTRFARLVQQGYYNGLTFHRVVPTFVIQGGSPGANEYMGDAPFMRDELGLRSHTRGTLGISTRGRDTGDAQIFVNLLDNPRLDHNYTVFAEVTAGMDIVDAVLEGDVIEKIEITSTMPVSQ